MKKAILFCLLSALYLGSSAQNCDPDTTITDPGIYPESLDTATVGVSFEHVLQILSLKDTMVLFGQSMVSATIDSIRIDSIKGLPASMSYACEPSTCVFTWEDVGCAVVSGTATEGEEGEHPLEIYVSYFARVGSITIPVQDTIEDYSLVIEAATTGILDLESGVFIGPNPSISGVFNYRTQVPVLGIRVFTTTGKLVYEESTPSSTGSIDLSALPKGVYVLVMESEQGRQLYKLIY